MAEKTEKYEQITDFIHQESVEQRCDNKALHDVSDIMHQHCLTFFLSGLLKKTK